MGCAIAALLLFLPWLADQLDLPWRFFFGPWIWPLIGIVVVVQLLLSVPALIFRLWLSLRHDRRWGLSTVSVRPLLRVIAVETLMGLVLSIALALASWTVFRRRDGSWVLEEWGVLAAYTFVTYAAWPFRLIAAYRTQPTPTQLEAEVDDLAARFGTRRPKLVVIDASAVRSAANASVSGLGPTTTVAVLDSLLALSSEDQRAVLAHEFGHIKNHDAEKRAAFVAVLSLVIAAAVTLLGDGWPFGDWFLTDLLASPGAYPAFTTVFVAINSYIFLALVNLIGRRSEKRADLFAVKALDNPKDFRDAIVRITVANRSALTVGGPIAGATCTHPPGEQRVRLIDDWISAHQVSK